MRVRHIYKAIEEETKAIHMKNRDARIIMEDVYIYLNLSKNLLIGELSPNLNTLQEVLGRIDVESVKEVLEYILSSKIQEGIEDALERCKQEDEKSKKLLPHKNAGKKDSYHKDSEEE